MKFKFWVIYLAITVLFTGIGYFALGNVSDIPLALSDSEMGALRGAAGWGEKCVKNANKLGCQTRACTPNTDNIRYYGFPYNACVATGTYTNCNLWGEATQVVCRKVYYNKACTEKILEKPPGKDYWVTKVRKVKMEDCNTTS